MIKLNQFINSSIHKFMFVVFTFDRRRGKKRLFRLVTEDAAGFFCFVFKRKICYTTLSSCVCLHLSLSFSTYFIHRVIRDTDRDDSRWCSRKRI